MNVYLIKGNEVVQSYDTLNNGDEVRILITPFKYEEGIYKIIGKIPYETIRAVNNFRYVEKVRDKSVDITDYETEEYYHDGSYKLSVYYKAGDDAGLLDVIDELRKEVEIMLNNEL